MEPSQPPRHIGRIRLSEIAGDWSENQALNPRLLASEVAGAIRSISEPGTPVAQGYAVVIGLVDNGPPAGIVTMWALADYFDGVSSGCVPDSMVTASGSIRAGTVLLSRSWLDRLVTEATECAAIASGLAQIMEAVPVQFGSSAALAYIQPTPPSGSDPECLAIRQTQQRQEGERSAGESLETAEQRTLLLEHENAKLRAQLASREHQYQQAQEDGEEHRRAALEERRQRTLAEEQLQDNAGIIAFMNPLNPLAPVEGQRLVSAWCVLTDNGDMDVVTQTGVGLKEHCRRWLTKLGTPTDVVVKRFVWALAWSARKKGGAVAKRQTEKG
ncbi:MAG: hypothetical protein ACOH2I_01120 [Pseudomonas sp.]